jgi:hypothetical protein
MSDALDVDLYLESYDFGFGIGNRLRRELNTEDGAG